MGKSGRSAVCLLGGIAVSLGVVLAVSGPAKGDFFASVIFGAVLGFPVYLVWNRASPPLGEKKDKP